ncbi:hypothetical protein [Lysobacter gummosus]|uniref:hypothetical protein n=1 Tax=Lysobacter gummosus TaxID=262324 RepID=UPI003643225A
MSGPAVCFASAKPSIQRLRRRLPVGVIFQIVLRAKAGIQRFQRHLSDRHSRERGNPVTSNVLARKALDVRLRRSKAEPAFAGMTVGSYGVTGS